MTRDNKSKQEQINSMEALLQREVEKHQAALHMLEDEHLTQKMQADHEIEVLNRKVSELELHVEAYDVIESENVTLRDRVDALMLQLEQENKNHAEEIHKVRLDMFNHKMALEKTFRKSLQELDADYLKKAFNAMSEESKNALVANAKLKDELQLQSIGVDNLMQRFSQQAKHYQRMKVNNDLLEQESHLRLQEVSSMKKAQLVASRTIEKLKDEVIKEDQEWKDQASKIVEQLRQENMHLQKLYEAGQKRCNKWKTRCLELTERETQRRADEQRAQTAPTSLSSWHPMSRAQSQPSLSQESPATARATMAVNYDAMWSASLKNSNQRQHKTDLVKSRKPAGAATDSAPSGSQQLSSVDLERIATANLEIRPRTVTQGRGCPHYGPTRLMRGPEDALVRARAKASLRDLRVLHISNAGLECIKHLELCRHALRSLYADENRLKDIEGILVLRQLWRVDLTDNVLRPGNNAATASSPLSPLASFAALGFLHLERNQLHFEDLVCLRDVHIMEIRLQGNPALLQDNATVTEYRAKVVALLPNVWILDGHYVSTREREHAVDDKESFVLYLLEKTRSNAGSASACTFGSTAELWGGMLTDDGGEGGGSTPAQNENATRLVEHIHAQRTRNVELADRHRLHTIVSLHNEESVVHNTHCKFAPSRFSLNARVMPKIPLQEILALSRQTRLEIAATFAAYLEFPFSKTLLVEALMIQVLDYGGFPPNAVEELASLPPYALTALLCILRHHAMDEEATLQRDSQQGISAPAPGFHRENILWASIPPLFTTLLGFDKDTRDPTEPTYQSFATRCRFVVGLLSMAASFPDDITDRRELQGSKDAASKSLSELSPLVQIARMALGNNNNAVGSDGSEPIIIMGPWVSDAAICSDSAVVRQEKTTRLPWKTKCLERDYPRPWAASKVSAALSASRSTGALDGVQEPKHSGKRKPRAGEWLEIKPKQFLKIRHLSEDESHVIAYRPIETSASLTIHVDKIARVSSSLWRVVVPDIEELSQLFEKATRSPSASKIGKLHRDSEGFHRHGAARNQGFPNHFVTDGDLHDMEKSPADHRSGQGISDQIAQPVALFCSNDTIDSNFVLAPPQLVSAQNYCAIKNFRELGQSPAGLWSPIKQAPFGIVAEKTPLAAAAASSSLKSIGNMLADVRMAKHREPPQVQAMQPQLSSLERESEWTVLQREMESVLGIKPRQSLSDSASFASTPAQGTPRANHDVLCFMTAIPPGEQDLDQDGNPIVHSDRVTTNNDESPRDAASDRVGSKQRFDTGSAAPSPHTRKRGVPQQTKSQMRSAAPSWHQVSTKPRLLVSSCSVPSLGRATSGHLLPSPSNPHSTAPKRNSVPNTSSPDMEGATSSTPHRSQQCSITLPTLAQK